MSNEQTNALDESPADAETVSGIVAEISSIGNGKHRTPEQRAGDEAAWQTHLIEHRQREQAQRCLRRFWIVL